MTSPHTVPYQAPQFTLRSADGKILTLSDFAGQWLVLYFYPKDNTPGCTAEACSLRDAHQEISAQNATVIGVSRDPATSHEKFAIKNKLPFMLASDPDHITMSKYGAWGPKMFGRSGVLRKTFIIDPKGMVRKVYGRVTPVGHGEQVAAELARLQAS